MTTNRSILIFLGVIFIIIVILSSRQISGTLRTRFGKFFPTVRLTGLTPTPTSFLIEEITPIPTTSPAVSGVETTTYRTETPPIEIPATGPLGLAWFIIGGSFSAGVLLRRLKTNLQRK